MEEPKEPLVFRRHDHGDKLVKSPRLFSLLEPSREKERVFPHLLIVPVVGFKEDCYRIGYGAGFFDRVFSQLEEIHKEKFLMIGVAFEAQRFDEF